jgi:hypothetical protein
MANPFSYPAYDLTTGNPLDPLPYKGVSFGRQVNNAGPWAGLLPITDRGVNKLDWRDASRTGRTLLCVDLLGTLVWSGILWTRKYRKTMKMLQVGATETGSYFRSRIQAESYDTTFEAGENPLLIVKRIMEDALTVSNFGGGLALTVVVHETGVAPHISAQYPGSSLQTIESIVSTLSQMGYGAGFDFSFDAQYKTGTTEPELVLNLWFPRQGRLYSETGIVLLDKDTLDWEYPEDSTQQATEISETGSGTGGVTPATASVALPGYPLLQRANSRTQVISEETLAEIAVGDLGVYSRPIVTPWIELAVPGPLNPGEFTLGDDLLWRIDPVSGGGENTNPRFPEGMSFEFRIDGYTVTPADQGISTLHLDLAIPPISTIPPPAPPL